MTSGIAPSKLAFPKHYVFFMEDILPRPDAAHLVTATQHANAAANLGYPAVFVHIRSNQDSRNPIEWVSPFHPRLPSAELVRYYNLQEKFRVVALPVPWPFGVWPGKWTSTNTLVCHYYFPRYIFPKTQLLQTNNWNLVKKAVRYGIPVIYEQEHYRKQPFEAEIAQHTNLVTAVTLSDPVRENMIKQGMPPEKILQVHLGFNQTFKNRQVEAAAEWRQTLLKDNRQYLVVYSGALYRFKGIDLMLDIAAKLPDVEFVFAGGDSQKVAEYQAIAAKKGAVNATFLGYLTHDRLVSLLQAADILVYPHLMGEAATFTSPLKFFEYMAVGAPMVCTEIPPLLPFKSADLAVTWCPPDDPQAMIAALRQTLATYPRKPEGYANNLQYVEQFSWENRIRRILERVPETLLLNLAPVKTE